ncbi:CBS domain-containing protein [Paraburkholderia caballeronis]|uniref:BON domain-containing protein n=1 Tax=Paraburkholderia caballeronis TaxID=416943 RepID=A0A1H7FYT5_9BURK|nr:CBS domain-containing protein [Paraburkholderia caballeronis]PXW24867.1 BON domain-containing protein [Paraburkholderia caballeronis]PXX00597.1 BON domain-containing protein [Paraburkholderia caballeronis]RAJ98660.1 BON domain-containing protein [Paraburkholderia caballeronis]SEE69464.1 BON domain-containing protein [Paraburkholderia caballeronis]SEK28585.1 BON domain-containing protein [Paraburkholderia caballeronis]
MRAQDVMTTNVVTVSPDTTVLDTAKLFVENRISGAPVLAADGTLVGVISEGDLLRRVEIGTDGPRRSSWLEFLSADGNAQAYVKSHALRVDDVMSRDVVSVDVDTSLADIAKLLESRGIKRVPVLREGRLAGIVSRANLLQAIASSSGGAPAEVSASDREIREKLVEELEGRPWSFAGRNIVVTDGVVHLWGVFRSMEAVQAVRVAAERIPGVRSVQDHTEPYPIAPGF